MRASPRSIATRDPPPALQARIRPLRRIHPLKRNMPAAASLSQDLHSHAGGLTVAVHILITAGFLEADAEGRGTPRRIAPDEPRRGQTRKRDYAEDYPYPVKCSAGKCSPSHSMLIGPLSASRQS